MRDFKTDQLIERLEELFGARGGNLTHCAVRIADLTAILEFPQAPRSAKAAGSTPTKAEFDALVDDVHAIYRQFKALSEAIRRRSSA
jgi:hypothetical protein